ncbi:MAG: squalene/phytoene synthase family protein [Gammaproteobacteria bacterium]
MQPLDEHLRQVCEERAPAAGSACGLARRFLAPHNQARVLALQALFASLRGVPAGVSEPAVGLAKLAWWENELREAAAGASRHPVVEALQRTGALEGDGSDFPGGYFTAVAARLDAPPVRSFDDLDGWLCDTYGAEARLLDRRPVTGAPAAGLQRMGAAAGLLELLESWAPGAERPAWVPLALVARAGASAGREQDLRAAVVAELAGTALGHLPASRGANEPAGGGHGGAPPGPFIAARHAVVRRRLNRLVRQPAKPPRAGLAGAGDVFAAWSAARRHPAADDGLE